MLERVASGGRLFAHELVLTELSAACLLVGRVDEASTLAGHLRELSCTHTGHGYQAHACRLLGDVAMHRDPPDVDQAAALAAAIDLYRAMDMILWLPQAEAALAQVSACDNAPAE